MRISIHGTDNGNAFLMALILIIILSSTVMSMVPRISVTQQYAQEYKKLVILEIEQKNRELINQYDIN